MGIKMSGFLGALVSLCFLIIFQVILVNIARSRAKESGSIRQVRFMDLIITCEDDSYSLSRLQMYLWTGFIVIGYSAVFASTPGIPDIPQTLYILMGVNFSTAVAATAINTYKTSKPNTIPAALAAPSPTPPATATPAVSTTPGAEAPDTTPPVTLSAAPPAAPPTTPAPTTTAVTAAVKIPPNFMNDIFFDSPDSLDMPRTQMFVWTVVSIGTFIVLLYQSFDSIPKLPGISEGLVALMGISNGAYLGAKASKKSG